MKLIYLGAELDSAKEYELFNITPEGFKVEITYKPDDWRTQRGHGFQVFESCTEVHNLYDGLGGEKDGIAFESDILADGFTRKVADIELVVISLMDRGKKGKRRS